MKNKGVHGSRRSPENISKQNTNLNKAKNIMLVNVGTLVFNLPGGVIVLDIIDGNCGIGGQGCLQVKL